MWQKADADVAADLHLFFLLPSSFFLLPSSFFLLCRANAASATRGRRRRRPARGCAKSARGREALRRRVDAQKLAIRRCQLIIHLAATQSVD
jgi:hypothetical protein